MSERMKSVYRSTTVGQALENAIQEYLEERKESSDQCLSDDLLRQILKEFDKTMKEELQNQSRAMAGQRGCKWSMKGTSIGYRNIDHFWTFEMKNAMLVREQDQLSSSKIKVSVQSSGDTERKRKN